MTSSRGCLLRCHRAHSWILRAEAADKEDWDSKFIAYCPPVAPAPLLGQHGTEALAEWLTMDAEQISALRKDSVVT